MSRIAVIGAGKTGRGFIGRLLAQAGLQFTLIDKDEVLIEKLRKKGSFDVHFFGNVRQPLTVDGFDALTYENADLSDTELILVSVGGTNLADVGSKLKDMLADGKKRYIIVCENASHPSKTLSEAIGLDTVSVTEATVFCTTIEQGELDIASENYPYLQCDSNPLDGFDPNVPAIRPIDNFGNFLTRKLYTYNAASCVIAYIGALKGYTDYGEAANDEAILKLLDLNYEQTNKALCKEFGYDEDDQKEFALLSKQKFCDRTITDTVARNAREPHRKLADMERIIGPMKLIYAQGQIPSVLITTVAAALCYSHPTDTVWNEMRAQKSVDTLLTELCGLEKNSFLYNAVFEKYNQMINKNFLF